MVVAAGADSVQCDRDAASNKSHTNMDPLTCAHKRPAKDAAAGRKRRPRAPKQRPQPPSPPAADDKCSPAGDTQLPALKRPHALDRRKRLAANARERKRMHLLNRAYDELRLRLADAQNKSKYDVLVQAKEYIQALASICDKFDRQHPNHSLTKTVITKPAPARSEPGEPVEPVELVKPQPSPAAAAAPPATLLLASPASMSSSMSSSSLASPMSYNSLASPPITGHDLRLNHPKSAAYRPSLHPLDAAANNSTSAKHQLAALMAASAHQPHLSAVAAASPLQQTNHFQYQHHHCNPTSLGFT